MNTDIRLNIEFWDHPKTVKLERRLGIQGVKCLQMLWFWVAKNVPDGDLSHMDAEDIEIAARWDGDQGVFFETLTSLRWIDLDGEKKCLHDWEEHNPWAAEAESRSRKARLSKLAQFRPGIYQAMKDQGVDGITKAEYERILSEPLAHRPNETPANGQRDDSESLAPSPSPSPNELKTNTLVGDQAADACADEGKLKPPRVQIPYSEVMQFWNTICGPRGKPRITELSETRKRKIRSLWRERPTADFRDIRTWEAFLNWCTKSELLMDGAWFTFDWLLKPENFLKITEGNYHLAPGGRKKAWGSQ